MGNRRHVSDEDLRRIFHRTGGRCHLCHEEMAWNGYGRNWNVDHFIAVSRGGSDAINNLYAAHVSCNSRRQDDSALKSRHVKAGRRDAPPSSEDLDDHNNAKSAAGAIAGAVAGAAFLGPLGAVSGALVGGLLSRATHDERPTTKGSPRRPPARRR
jgi:hypothetical protein